MWSPILGNRLSFPRIKLAGMEITLPLMLNNLRQSLKKNINSNWSEFTIHFSLIMVL
jgi:hypothetical protein